MTPLAQILMVTRLYERAVITAASKGDTMGAATEFAKMEVSLSHLLAKPITEPERALLLTVGRILRARIKEDVMDPSGSNAADYEALCEALEPFDAIQGEPQNGEKKQ